MTRHISTSPEFDQCEHTHTHAHAHAHAHARGVPLKNNPHIIVCTNRFGVCNVCGVVGIDKQKSSEDLTSKCRVYSESMMVGARESISRGFNNDVHRGGRTVISSR